MRLLSPLASEWQAPPPSARHQTVVNCMHAASGSLNRAPSKRPPPPPKGFTVRTEGKASILQRANDVFFNPAQVVNRDMSLSGEGEGERGP